MPITQRIDRAGGAKNLRFEQYIPAKYLKFEQKCSAMTQCACKARSCGINCIFNVLRTHGSLPAYASGRKGQPCSLPIIAVKTKGHILWPKAENMTFITL